MSEAPQQTQTNTDPEYQKAKNAADLAAEQARLAVALKDKQAAENTMAQSGIPKIPVTPLSGTATVDANFNIDGQILAYREIAKLTEQVVKEVKEVLGDERPKILLMSEEYVPWIEQYRSMIESLKYLIDAYQEKQPEPTVPKILAPKMLSPTAIGEVIKTAVDFMGLFRTNIDVKGVAVKIEDMALSSELAKRFLPLQIDSIHLNPLSLMLLPSNTSDLTDKLSKLENLKAHADQQVSQLESNPNRATSENTYLSRLKALNSQVDSLITSLYKNDDKTGCNQFSQLYKAEKVNALLKTEPSPCVLWAKVLAAGGANITKQNILGSSIFSTGGAVISFFLLNNTGKVLASGVFSGNAPPKEFK